MKALERVITKLSGLRRVRDGVYRANCPSCGGHSGTKFSIKQTDSGVVVHCFAGCPLETILEALGMTSARELFDSVKHKSEPATPESLRRQRIERGLQVWADQRLIEICRHLRHVEAGISDIAKVITIADLENEDIAETLAQLYRRRNNLECEWHTLTSGDLTRIYGCFRESK